MVVIINDVFSRLDTYLGVQMGSLRGRVRSPKINDKVPEGESLQKSYFWVEEAPTPIPFHTASCVHFVHLLTLMIVFLITNINLLLLILYIFSRKKRFGILGNSLLLHLCFPEIISSFEVLLS